MPRRRHRKHGVVGPETGDGALLRGQAPPRMVDLDCLLVIFGPGFLAVFRRCRQTARRTGGHRKRAVLAPLGQERRLLLHDGAGRYPVSGAVCRVSARAISYQPRNTPCGVAVSDPAKAPPGAPKQANTATITAARS